MKYAVVIDRPYYPSVQLFETLAEARKRAYELAESENDPNGHYEGHVYVMAVKVDLKIKTSY